MGINIEPYVPCLVDGPDVFVYVGQGTLLCGNRAGSTLQENPGLLHLTLSEEASSLCGSYLRPGGKKKGEGIFLVSASTATDSKGGNMLFKGRKKNTLKTSLVSSASGTLPQVEAKLLEADCIIAARALSSPIEKVPFPKDAQEPSDINLLLENSENWDILPQSIFRRFQSEPTAPAPISKPLTSSPSPFSSPQPRRKHLSRAVYDPRDDLLSPLFSPKFKVPISNQGEAKYEPKDDLLSTQFCQPDPINSVAFWMKRQETN